MCVCRPRSAVGEGTPFRPPPPRVVDGTHMSFPFLLPPPQLSVWISALPPSLVFKTTLGQGTQSGGGLEIVSLRTKRTGARRKSAAKPVFWGWISPWIIYWIIPWTSPWITPWTQPLR